MSPPPFWGSGHGTVRWGHRLGNAVLDKINGRVHPAARRSSMIASALRLVMPAFLWVRALLIFDRDFGQHPGVM